MIPEDVPAKLMLLEPLGTVSASITQAADVLILSASLGFLLVLLTAFGTRRKTACLADPAVSFIMQRILAESTWRLRNFARHVFAARLLAFVAGPCLKSGLTAAETAEEKWRRKKSSK